MSDNSDDDLSLFRQHYRKIQCKMPASGEADGHVVLWVVKGASTRCNDHFMVNGLIGG